MELNDKDTPTLAEIEGLPQEDRDRETNAETEESKPTGLSVGTYLDNKSYYCTSITVFPRDVVVSRKLANAQSRPLQGGGVRQPIAGFSAQSRRRLKCTLRNIPRQVYLLTLTYPNKFASDGEAIKRHIASFVRWIKSQGVRTGIWILEFQARGAPHFHLVFSTPIDRSACDRQWAKIIDTDCDLPLTRLGEIRHWGMTINYLLKNKSKQVPQGFDHTGRFWAAWGGLKPIPVISVVDTEKTTTIARHLRKAHERKHPMKRKYDGRYGQTLYDEGPSAMKNMTRLLEHTVHQSERAIPTPRSLSWLLVLPENRTEKQKEMTDKLCKDTPT
jgi:hypothetical protein